MAIVPPGDKKKAREAEPPTRKQKRPRRRTTSANNFPFKKQRWTRFATTPHKWLFVRASAAASSKKASLLSCSMNLRYLYRLIVYPHKQLAYLFHITAATAVD